MTRKAPMLAFQPTPEIAHELIRLQSLLDARGQPASTISSTARLVMGAGIKAIKAERGLTGGIVSSITNRDTPESLAALVGTWHVYLIGDFNSVRVIGDTVFRLSCGRDLESMRVTLRCGRLADALDALADKYHCGAHPQPEQEVGKEDLRSLWEAALYDSVTTVYGHALGSVVDPIGRYDNDLLQYVYDRQQSADSREGGVR